MKPANNEDLNETNCPHFRHIVFVFSKLYKQEMIKKNIVLTSFKKLLTVNSAWYSPSYYYYKLVLFKPYDIYKFENILDTIKRELALCGIDSKLQQQKNIKKTCKETPKKNMSLNFTQIL